MSHPAFRCFPEKIKFTDRKFKIKATKCSGTNRLHILAGLLHARRGFSAFRFERDSCATHERFCYLLPTNSFQVHPLLLLSLLSPFDGYKEDLRLPIMTVPFLHHSLRSTRHPVTTMP